VTADVPCGVRHVRLDLEPCDIRAEAGESAVLVFFWWRELPLGRRLFTAGELPVPPSAVFSLGADAAAGALSAWLPVIPEDLRGELDALIDRQSLQAANTPLSVSVVVCTRNRHDSLATCLASILRCDPAPDEIVVVDNAPSDRNTWELCERLPNIRYLLEPKGGLSRARNAGLAAATGDIVAYTDDDVVVAANWIGALRGGFSDPAIASVTGIVLPQSLVNEAAFAFELDYGGLAPSFIVQQYDAALLRQSVWRGTAGMAHRCRCQHGTSPIGRLHSRRL
jgi:hypothetical protein